MRTCINGTLYSLLQKKVFRELGFIVELDKILLSLLESESEHMNKQIQYILDSLNSKDDENEIVEEENNEEIEESNLELNDDADEEDEMIDENYVRSIALLYIIIIRLKKILLIKML